MKQFFLIIFLAFLAVSLGIKGVDLWTIGTNVDGDGIGIHFMGFEINDRVSKDSIPSYAAGFIMTGLATLLLTVLLIAKKTQRTGK